jgi:hypothetical protein
MSEREWRPVPGYVGRYEVCNEGLVRAVPRRIQTENGLRIIKQRVLKPHLNKDGYEAVGLWLNRHPKTFFIHRLVLEAFVGPMPEGNVTRHLDGNCRNNHLSNLAYGTRLENSADMLRHGTWANKTHCTKGHLFDERNTYYKRKDGKRGCRACNRLATKRYQERKRKATA